MPEMPAPATYLMEIPAELVPHIVLPRLELLSEARTRGAECVWGGERLTGETAIDLGKHTDGGFNTRSAVRAARNAHPDRCTECRGPADLYDTRRALHNLLLELLR
ncbi:hypothetical protein [Streptomyces achromogenes]|uniref:hypothetical protein n=1 Tax=Streptomyces achromogenes TaxID=67255 RepID=UPI0036C62132